jgi:hypothetical protein
MRRAPTASTPSKGSSLAHALGVFGDDLAVGMELKEVHQTVGALDGHRTRQAVHAADELQEFDAREAVEEQRLVGNDADAAFDFEVLLGQTIAQEFHRAAIVRNQTGENADGGGLTGAVGAEKAEERSARHLEIDAIDCGLGSVVFLQAADQDRGRLCGAFLGHAYEYKWSRA